MGVRKIAIPVWTVSLLREKGSSGLAWRHGLCSFIELPADMFLVRDERR